MRARPVVKRKHMPPTAPSRLVGVMDIGSTFIRMTIAEGRGEGRFTLLERVVHSGAIGREVVASRRIRYATSEQCLAILRS